MTTYYVDTNVLLRWLLDDDPALTAQARSYLQKAKDGEWQLVLISQIVFELDYVMRKVYGLPREETAHNLELILKSTYMEIPDRSELLSAIEWYRKSTIDLADCFLFAMAQSKKAEVLSFDGDIKKLQRGSGMKESEEISAP